ncbi:MAG TPA: CapA family protein [Pyrinomonadaceae bacterium]|nr:CapA family protein [Pyrinomonadaceae bacterium]
MPKYSSLSPILNVIIVIASVAASSCQKTDLTTPIAEAQEKPAALAKLPASEETITIAAVGDIMLGSTSINDSFLPPNDGRDILKAVTPELSSADITFGNLEGPMLEGGKSEKCADTTTTPKNEINIKPSPSPAKPATPPKPVRCFAFRVPTRYGKYLKDAGFDVMSLANNHASDFGELGRISTRKVLDDLGIKHAGSDRDKYSTTIFEVRGKKIAFVGFAHNAISPNVNEVDAAKLLVAAARKKADIVVVSFHGGAEGEGAQNVPRQTEIFVGEKRGNLPLFTHAVIDAGADLVLGHGPHVLRGMEVYKDHLIVYSMGNFATYGMFNLKGVQGISAIFNITLRTDGKFSAAKIIPVKQEGRGGPVPDPSGAAIRKLQALSNSNFGAAAPKIGDDGTISIK